MRTLYIRNKSDTGESTSNDKHYRNIYYSWDENYFRSLSIPGCGTPRINKVIPLKRKIDLD